MIKYTCPFLGLTLKKLRKPKKKNSYKEKAYRIKNSLTEGW